MLFVLFALWIIALLLLIIDPRSSTMRWMSAVAFTGGIGALAAVLSENIIPYVKQTIPNPSVSELLFHIQATSSLLSYYGLPYSFAMLALQYNPSWPNQKTRTFLPYLLLLPPIACILLTPGYTEVMPITFPIVACWVVPYIVTGAILIASRKERLPGMQRTHLFTCLALLPPILCFAVLNYVMPSLGYYRMWIYHTWILALVVPFLIFTFFKYGFLGMRLLIERRKLDSTLRAITSGTAIMNHAIKNDVGKMRLFLEKMKQYAEETNQPELMLDLDVVMGASMHIRDMISRVHEQTQELPIRVSPVNMEELLIEALQSLTPYLSKVKLSLTISKELTLEIDRIQIAETLTNVLMNAVEAMPLGGELTVKGFMAKKNVVLEIRDTGIGMEKAVLKQVLEPFYTTKSGSRNNFGLGLAYCYSVMKKHGGSLELSSETNKGTSVFLTFPGSRRLST
ncbi:HAMP domain-containing histidine kinase [Paenibacillus sp. SYP-B3998]|uniref:histidine kinase n=1 Tax=Paenibacillus sp. SYP-B3998 TaxID=2678564 RepID=A0A6G3ZVL3_9BACL|nr:HAMP domain-containing sensor histidine kinase [Paenibacillus sp. SYP-B3998]NEW06253.1 HAMP domain-containing histidine kinase [Paenibacillus sp. SYP-B3998]